MRKELSRQIIEKVKLKRRGLCFYCGVELPESDSYIRAWDVDHVIPVSKGGTNDFENLEPSCKTCNQKKGAKDFSDFVIGQIRSGAI